jgi:hypothetical protein
MCVRSVLTESCATEFWNILSTFLTEVEVEEEEQYARVYPKVSGLSR